MAGEPLQKWFWPPALKSRAKYMATEHLAQKDCDHFIAQDVPLNASGVEITVQVDLWTANDTSFPCQISVFEPNADPRIHITWIFDGFSDVIPRESQRCSAAQVVCAKPDWMCTAIPGTDQDALGAALQWVCSPSVVDCDPINPGGLYFEPNTVLDHCNWAFNTYFQYYKALYGEEACFFAGTAQLGPRPKTRYNHQIESASVASHTIPNKPQKQLWSHGLETFLRQNFWLLYPADLVCGN